MRYCLYCILSVLLTTASCLPAQTTLSLGPGTPVNSMIAGVNNNFIRGDIPYDDAGFRQMIGVTQLTTLRYPGGTSGSLFDWQTNQYVSDDILKQYGPPSWYERHKAMKDRIAQSPPGTFKADNFAAMCKALNIEPVWIPNPVTVSPENNIRFFEHLKQAGIACNYVEMGNECSGGAFWKCFPRGSDYANAIRPVMQKIRQLYPDVKIAVVANGHNVMKMSQAQQESGSANVRGDTWNDMLMPDRKLFDAIVLHSYGVSPDRLREYRPDQWESFTLAYPGVYMNAVASMSRELYGGIPVWLTEYNAAFHHLMEGRPRKHDAAEEYFAKVSDSSMHGLMIASYMIGALNDPQMWPVMNYHSLVGPEGFRLTSRIDGVWHIGPKAQIFSYISSLIRQAETTRSVEIHGGTSLDFTILDNQSISALAAAVLENDTQRHWLMINRSSNTLTVSLPWDQTGKATIHSFAGTLAPSDSQTMWRSIDEVDTNEQPWDQPLSTKPETVDRVGSQTQCSLAIPAYSLTVVSQHKATK